MTFYFFSYLSSLFVCSVFQGNHDESSALATQCETPCATRLSYHGICTILRAIGTIYVIRKCPIIFQVSSSMKKKKHWFDYERFVAAAVWGVRPGSAVRAEFGWASVGVVEQRKGFFFIINPLPLASAMGNRKKFTEGQ